MAIDWGAKTRPVPIALKIKKLLLKFQTLLPKFLHIFCKRQFKASQFKFFAYRKTKRQQKMVLFWDILNSHNWCISQGIDDKKLTAWVLLDMSKAFDSVEHQILLRKIQSVGASTSALNGLTATFQIDIKLYEFIVPFLILFQLNVAFLKAVF